MDLDEKKKPYLCGSKKKKKKNLDLADLNMFYLILD